MYIDYYLDEKPIDGKVFVLHKNCYCCEETAINLLGYIFDNMLKTLSVKTNVACDICKLDDVININDIIDQLTPEQKVDYSNRYHEVSKNVSRILYIQQYGNRLCPKCTKLCGYIESHDHMSIYNGNDIDKIVKCDCCGYVMCSKCQIKYDLNLRLNLTEKVNEFVNLLLICLIKGIIYLTYVPIAIIELIVYMMMKFIITFMISLIVIVGITKFIISDLLTRFILVITIFGSVIFTAFNMISYFIGFSNFISLSVTFISFAIVSIVMTLIIIFIQRRAKVVLTKLNIIKYKELEIVHNNKSCDDVKIQIELSSKAALLLDTIKCPKCPNYIHKYEGCNHITCLCKHEFCYLCGGDWVGHEYNTCITIQMTNIINMSPYMTSLKESNQMLYNKYLTHMNTIENEYNRINTIVN